MNAYLYDAVRTPRGKATPEGGLASKKPDELIASLVSALESRIGPASPQALLLGAVGQVGAQGGNIALVSKFRANLPDDTTAVTINNYCVSGLTAIGQAAASVTSGQARQVLAGGVEMMSRVAFLADAADYYGDTSLPKGARFLPPVLAAERLGKEFSISRADLDEVALMSQERANASKDSALNASMVAANDLKNDECPRSSTTAESLKGLEPAFGELAVQFRDLLGDDVPPLHTIAHAPPMCDGAGLALIGDEDALDAAPRARILGWAEVGGDPAASLTAGFTAMDRVLEQTGKSIGDMGRIEFMEAFGVIIAKFCRDNAPDLSRVNVGGGHLAKGHPLGATGAIILSSLLDALDDAGESLGLVVATGASGIGSAMVVERLDN
jgi:acetyl-CoA C-acetyltransferase/acetyl-CoA acyltransferase